LLAHLDAPPQRGRQRREGRRHDIGEDAGALAPAGDQQPERPVRRGRVVAGAAQGCDGGPNRVADAGDTARTVAGDAFGLGERRGDCRGAPGEQPVGAAEHRILLVQHAGDAEPPARHQRRHRRVAAEADGGSGPDAAQETRRLYHRADQPEHGEPARHGAAHAGAADCDGVSFDAPEHVAEGGAPPIRHEDKTTATRLQLGRKGLCREHVAASSACCEENGRVERRRSQNPYPSALRRSRVSASTMPSPTAVAIVDEPP